MINLELSNYDYIKYQTFRDKIDNCGAVKTMEDILVDINCTKLYKGRQIMKTTDIMYKEYVERYFRCLNLLKDYKLYNQYFDKLINLDNYNIEFESTFKEMSANEIKSKKQNKTKTKRNKPKNVYIEAISKDLFTGDTIYIYDNFFTGDTITSNTRLDLNELNKPKRKQKEDKILYPLKLGTLIFKKK